MNKVIGLAVAFVVCSAFSSCEEKPKCPNRGTKVISVEIEKDGTQLCSGIGDDGTRQTWDCPKFETETPGHNDCGAADAAPGLECVFKENLPVMEFRINCGIFAAKCPRGEGKMTAVVQNFEARKCQ